MVGFKHILCALLLTIITGGAIAQNNTNSPYTRYGYGDLSDQSFGNSKAMGGIAFGLRDGAQINPLNPASYTAIDSLTFLFEGGVTLQNMNISSGADKLNAKNSSFDYLAMQFRLHPRIGMSIGLLPFSNIGYSVSDIRPNEENTLDTYKIFSGDGGLHQLYAGIGVKVLKNLSVGVNASYLWGDIDRTRTINYPNVANVYYIEQVSGISVSNYKLDFGAQYTFDISKKHAITLGAVYSPKHKIANDYSIITQMKTINRDGSISIISYNSLEPDAALEIPDAFGFGFTYKYDNRLTIGVDYSLQQWSKAKFELGNGVAEEQQNEFNETYAFSDRTKVSVGAEYIPNLIGRSYFSHIKYRVGGYYTTPYYKIDGKRASREYGVTAGFGLPVPRSRSILSISGQFVRVKGLETNMVNENIFRVSIGLTFNERWFFKRRVE